MALWMISEADWPFAQKFFADGAAPGASICRTHAEYIAGIQEIALEAAAQGFEICYVSATTSTVKQKLDELGLPNTPNNRAHAIASLV